MKTFSILRKLKRLSNQSIAQCRSSRSSSARGRGPAFLKFCGLILAAGLWAASSVQAQTTIAQNNLIQNGGFDSGSAGWSTSGGGAYFYTAGSDSILSLGWWDGCSFWQNTGATVQSGLDYVLTIRAEVGQSPLTGVQLSLQDVTAGWTIAASQDFTFPDQTTAWRVTARRLSAVQRY